MTTLFAHLNHIHELLDQILGISNNQTAILLNEKKSLSEENENLDLLEAMVEIKGQLINELQREEELFQERYNELREELLSSAELIRVKELVDNILKKKARIVQEEQNNVLLMQTKERRAKEVLPIPKPAIQVVQAYQKQQTKT